MTSVARDVGAPSTDPALTIYPDERASLLTFAADMQHRGSWSSATVRASLGGYSITTDRVRATGIESAAVKARDASLRLSGERAGQRSRLVTGIDVVSRFGLRASGSIDNASRRDAGAWGAWSGEVARWMQLAAGARADYVTTRNRGGWFGDHARSDVALSGYGALTAGPFQRVTTTLQLASGYREPSLSDRYYRGVSGRGFVIGNPDLEPERSVQLDAGVRWNGARSRVALFAYDYRIRNLVERYRSGSDFFFRNRGEGEIRGLEAEAMTPVRPNIELQLGAALASGRDLGSGDSLDDIAPPTLHASLRWASARASAFVTAAAYARDHHPGPVEAPRPGYAELDLGAGWRLSPLLELRLVLRNATNAKHFGSSDAAAAQAPGRSMLIGINR
jgi:outer membrane receptor protein involved in Fe transport